MSAFVEWRSGRSSVAPSFSFLRALLRWWWKDLSNGITHRDKCSEPSGSSHLPLAFQRVALICCWVVYLGHCVLREMLYCLIHRGLFLMLFVIPAPKYMCDSFKTTFKMKCPLVRIQLAYFQGFDLQKTPIPPHRHPHPIQPLTWSHCKGDVMG